jgi:hypothetical protein
VLSRPGGDLYQLAIAKNQVNGVACVRSKGFLEIGFSVRERGMHQTTSFDTAAID